MSRADRIMLAIFILCFVGEGMACMAIVKTLLSAFAFLIGAILALIAIWTLASPTTPAVREGE